MVLNAPTQPPLFLSSPPANAAQDDYFSPRRPTPLILALDTPASPARTKPTHPTLSRQPTALPHAALSRVHSLAPTTRAGTPEDGGLGGAPSRQALMRMFTASNQGSFLHEEMGDISAFLEEDIED